MLACRIPCFLGLFSAIYPQKDHWWEDFGPLFVFLIETVSHFQPPFAWLIRRDTRLNKFWGEEQCQTEHEDDDFQPTTPNDNGTLIGDNFASPNALAFCKPTTTVTLINANFTQPRFTRSIGCQNHHTQSRCFYSGFYFVHATTLIVVRDINNALPFIME